MNRGASPPATATTTSPRYELKAIAEDGSEDTIRTWLRLHPMGFAPAHPSRQVNNVYFDTPDLASFVANLAGDLTRKKVRLRWYGDHTAGIQSCFEVKLKRDRIGWKLAQQLLTPLDLDCLHWQAVVTTVRDELADVLRTHLDAAPWPVLINRYLREYYASFDGRVRVTLDYAHVAYDQRHHQRPFLKFALPSQNVLIVELKASVSDSAYLLEAASSLPLRIGRSSKYVDTVDMLLW